MITVELRRHSIRGEEKGLTPFGIQLAKDARRSLAPQYALVLSSPKKRCRQTVEAFGFRRYLIEPRLGTLDYGAFDDFSKSIEKVRRKKKLAWIEAAFLVKDALPALRETGREVLKTVQDIAHFLKDGERALAVTHGDLPELAALMAFDDFDFKRLGRPLSFCEGVALAFDGEKLVRADILRLAGPSAKPSAAQAPVPAREAAAV